MEADDLTSIEKDKRILRNEISLIKKQYSTEILGYKSDIICKNLTDTPEFKNSARIAAYSSLPDEVQTLKLIEEWKEKKHIYLPVVEGNEMIFRKYNGANRMITGVLGIKEPDEDSEKTEISDIDLFIVPGIAFDRNYNRTGRGKGFYDRTLSHVNKPITGLCFKFQLYDNIPANQYDIKMTKIITEDLFF
ncbi:MAG: 5-formyltetrahydrofolate cyclo-ligase [Tannerella sp.]|jgi:5-formyltetrahydrofolate cyclo-ligase|nr:5-formyltetrahydrofolate cyclo-ligase [Tannerella sp.]